MKKMIRGYEKIKWMYAKYCEGTKKICWIWNVVTSHEKTYFGYEKSLTFWIFQISNPKGSKFSTVFSWCSKSCKARRRSHPARMAGRANPRSEYCRAPSCVTVVRACLQKGYWLHAKCNRQYLRWHEPVRQWGADRSALLCALVRDQWTRVVNS